jgi:hypothetical protein
MHSYFYRIKVISLFYLLHALWDKPHYPLHVDSLEANKQ